MSKTGQSKVGGLVVGVGVDFQCNFYHPGAEKARSGRQRIVGLIFWPIAIVIRK